MSVERQIDLIASARRLVVLLGIKLEALGRPCGVTNSTVKAWWSPNAPNRVPIEAAGPLLEEILAAGGPDILEVYLRPYRERGLRRRNEALLEQALEGTDAPDDFVWDKPRPMAKVEAPKVRGRRAG